MFSKKNIMAYYEELTPYNYSHYCTKELNVGWLQKGQPFPVGKTPDGFIERLKLFCEKPYPLFYAGHHPCDFCDDKKATSSCEIRVVGEYGIVYASPILLLHYIESHGYLPPKKFIDAVMKGPEPGSDEYQNAVYKDTLPFWERRRPDANDDDYEEKMRAFMIDNLSKEVDSRIISEVLEKNKDFQKFIRAYNSVMPSVYAVNLDKKNKK